MSPKVWQIFMNVVLVAVLYGFLWKNLNKLKMIFVTFKCSWKDFKITSKLPQQNSVDNLNEAIEFLREFDREAASICNSVATSEWKFTTNSTEYNKRRMREQQNLSSKFECLSWRRASRFDTTKVLDSNIRRQLGRIVQQGRCGLGDDKYLEVCNFF